MKPLVLVLFIACFARGAAAAEPPLKLLHAGYWGTAADDDLQGAAEAPDGTVYLAGNAGAAAGLPGGVTPTKLGAPVKDPKCGRGFIAHFSADLENLLDYAELAEGIAILTTVQVNDRGVYVSGYASAGLEPLLQGKPGLMQRYPLAAEAQLIQEGKMLAANGLKDKDPIEARPGLGRLGAPFVLRMTANLQTVTAGTYLEGWQQVWDKLRCKTIRPHVTFAAEYFWQPTLFTLLRSGDLVVCHDGGYFRRLTAEDRKTAGTDADLLRRLAFYDTCDWVSRLSPDLSKRMWRQPIYTPTVDTTTVKSLKGGWPLGHYGSPRTHRMRLDARDAIYLCGWSASATAKEPWWSPYVWKLDPAEGKLLWTAYQYDPMSGSDHRMLGTVADTAVTSLALDGDGNLLASLLADGGNTVMGWSPRAELGRKFEVPIKGGAPNIKLVHWWSMIHRVNTQTRQGLGGTRIASKTAQGPAGPGWVVDLASLPGNGVLAVGRCNFDFACSQDAWQQPDPDENPTGFLRVYSAEFDLQFSTALRGVIPLEIVPLCGDRFLVVGQTRNVTAPVAGGRFEKPRGKADGFLCLVQFVRGIAKAPSTTGQ